MQYYIIFIFNLKWMIINDDDHDDDDCLFFLKIIVQKYAHETKQYDIV